MACSMRSSQVPPHWHLGSRDPLDPASWDGPCYGSTREQLDSRQVA